MMYLKGAEKFYKAIGYDMKGQGPVHWVNGAELNFGAFIKHVERTA